MFTARDKIGRQQPNQADLKQQILKTLIELINSGDFAIELNGLLKRGINLVDKTESSNQEKLNQYLLGIILYVLARNDFRYEDLTPEHFSFEPAKKAIRKMTDELVSLTNDMDRDLTWETIFEEVGKRVLTKEIPFIDEFNGSLSNDQNIQAIISKYLPIVDVNYQFNSSGKGFRLT